MILSVNVLNSIPTLNSMIESSLWSSLSMNTWQYRKFKLCSIFITLSMLYLNRVEIELTTCHYLYICILIIVLHFYYKSKMIEEEWISLFINCTWFIILYQDPVMCMSKYKRVFKTWPSALGLEGDKAKQHKQKVSWLL